MKIIKRNGSEETFNPNKIVQAVRKADNANPNGRSLTDEQINGIAVTIRNMGECVSRALSVEEIQELVETA